MIETVVAVGGTAGFVFAVGRGGFGQRIAVGIVGVGCCDGCILFCLCFRQQAVVCVVGIRGGIMLCARNRQAAAIARLVVGISICGKDVDKGRPRGLVDECSIIKPNYCGSGSISGSPRETISKIESPAIIIK